MATEAQGQMSTGPQVRNACEKCHSRKNKCHPTEDGGCRSCQTNGRLCFFLPRNKSGRPKVGEDGTKETRQANPGLGTTTAAAAAAIAEHAAMAEANAGPMSPLRVQQSRTGSNFTQSPTNSSRSTSQHSNNHMMRPHCHPRSMSDANAGTSFPISDSMDWANPMYPKQSLDNLADMDMDSAFHFQEMPPTDAYLEYPGMSMNMPSQHTSSASYLSLANLGNLPSMSSTEFDFSRPGFDFFPSSFSSMPPSSMPSTSVLGQGDQKGPERCFPTLLGHIHRLQRCYEKVRSGTLFSYPHTRNAQLKMVVSTIDSGCMATCTMLKDQFQAVLGQRAEARMNNTQQQDFRGPSAGRPDHSLIALAITTILTIARICQALMQSELPEAQSSLDNMLLFKRLGCNILQTRIALMNIEKLDPGLTYLTQDATREISIVQA
jgi:hypothetical protein